MKSPLNKYFKEIYVIYMPNREKYIRDFFKEIDTKVTFVPAISRDNLPKLSILLKKNIINKYFLLTGLQKSKIYGYPSPLSIEKIENNNKYISIVKGLKGTLALQLSYMKCFEMFLKTKADKCLIFEDDLILPGGKDKEEAIKKLYNRFESIFGKELENVNWDIVNLGRCQDICSINIKFSENLVIETHPFCTQSVAYSRKVAEETLLNSLPLSNSGDWLMAWFYYNNPLYKCFSVKGILFDQNPDLGTMLGHYESLPECQGDKKGLKNKN
jgi:hypothetical protein